LSILALDLGTTTGWASCRDGAVVAGTLDLRGGRYEGGGMRFLRFRQWLDELTLGSDNAVYFEEVRNHKGVDAAHVYGGLMGVLTSFCEERGIPYQGVPVGTVKKHLTGKGNANKDAMLAAARARWPECFADPKVARSHDMADALAILDVAMATAPAAGKE